MGRRVSFEWNREDFFLARDASSRVQPAFPSSPHTPMGGRDVLPSSVSLHALLSMIPSGLFETKVRRGKNEVSSNLERRVEGKDERKNESRLT